MLTRVASTKVLRRSGLYPFFSDVASSLLSEGMLSTNVATKEAHRILVCSTGSPTGVSSAFHSDDPKRLFGGGFLARYTKFGDNAVWTIV